MPLRSQLLTMPGKRLYLNQAASTAKLLVHINTNHLHVASTPPQFPFFNFSTSLARDKGAQATPADAQTGPGMLAALLRTFEDV